MAETAHHWYALFVRSRHEFVTTGQLRKQGVEVFLPSITRMRRWSDRDKAVKFPLFPGYVFVYVQPSAETFMSIVRTHGTVAFVSQEPGYPARIDPQEMQSLRRIVESGENFDIYPHLCEGATVLVKQGPLKGATGVLVKKEDHSMFLVNISILGRSIGTKVNAEDLEVL
jgi:transcription antitermination factor NusG